MRRVAYEAKRIEEIAAQLGDMARRGLETSVKSGVGVDQHLEAVKALGTLLMQEVRWMHQAVDSEKKVKEGHETVIKGLEEENAYLSFKSQILETDLHKSRS